MKTLSRWGRAAAVLAAVLSAGAPPAAALQTAVQVAPLPRDSIYQLAVNLTDQQGRRLALGDLRGAPVIVSMFYTSCQFVCPLLIDAIQATEQKLTPAQRERVNVLLLSFDPAHDTVAALRKTADERHLDDTRWSLTRTDSASVRKVAALLDIQYRALRNGEFNHSTVLLLLDADGRIVARTSDISKADPVFLKAVRSAADGAARRPLRR